MIAISTPVAELPPYLGYAYGYPHKTAYRPLAPPLPLEPLWAGEEKSHLFLYLHVPFCEMRCGFCNLFTAHHPGSSRVAAYLEALRRQAQQVRAALGPCQFARMAVGGGTPTFLTPAELAELFQIAHQVMGADPHLIPTSVETSPHTATPDRLALLRQLGVSRISLGVQSFLAEETRALGRGQNTDEVQRALCAIRQAGFPTLNVDLIYGVVGQNVASWLRSLDEALRFQPEELYLYPLYVRPATGLGKLKRAPLDTLRLELYRAGRQHLLAAGYEQVSMRMFCRRGDLATGPVYCCQEDGMVGLGAGARSYTTGLHYSTEYAIQRSAVLDIIDDFLTRPDARHAQAEFGIALDGEEQRRRFVILSLLQVSGLDLASYAHRFGKAAFEDLPALQELEDAGLAQLDAAKLVLTPEGLELSDAIGPWLFSSKVASRMAGEV